MIQVDLVSPKVMRLARPGNPAAAGKLHPPGANEASGRGAAARAPSHDANSSLLHHPPGARLSSGYIGWSNGARERPHSRHPRHPLRSRTNHVSTQTPATAACDLRVGGMDCASCAATIEAALRKLDGVDDVRVDVVAGRVRVDYASEAVSPAEFAAAIRRVGYRVDGDEQREPGSGPAPPAERAAAPRRRSVHRGRIALTAASGAALALAILLGALGWPGQAKVALLALATVAGGWYVVPRGIRAARGGALDMNFLMSVAAAGAWAIGEPTEAAATLFLFAIAELLEAYSMDRARNAIAALMELSPAEATVVRDGAEQRIAAADVAVGEHVIVRPGEKIPVDGLVTDGRSAVNQAPITGESMPVDKAPDDEVFAGSLNGPGVLMIRAAKEHDDTTLARIIHAVEEAQASRAPSQRFVDRFARVYTPAVVGMAILIAVVPPIVGVGGWETWIYRALTMLVIACPCALVISTPVTIVSGLTGAAHAGVLIKGGVHLENAGRVRTIAFDKTGTLTGGAPAVTDVVALDGRDENAVLRLASGVERHSEHPIARAILAFGRARGIEPPPSIGFKSETGRGARAVVDGETIEVGNERLSGVADPRAAAALRRLERDGKTAVLVSAGARALGVIAVADQVRPEAAEALRALRHAGIRRVVMLTGDSAAAARGVAESLGGIEWRAELLPHDKVRIVRELEAEGEPIAFVGDGVNDAPALAAATLGIAMGAAGTDVALETADVALMGDDLTRLALAIRLSHKTLRVMKENIALSIAIKAVFLVLAAVGWATLWMAVAADMGASLIVVMNGLRARRIDDAT